MTDYKDTLNLPQTNFPMKANLVNREKIFLEKWQKDNIYKIISENNKGKPKFILHDGPPYANGDIHLGHAVNKVLKDMIVKSKLLSGFDAPYVPGWDCHGLPIEHNIEKKKGKVGIKISAKEFRLECRKYVDTQIEKQKKDFIRLGIFGDWDNPYLTKNYKYEADIVRAFGKIIENKHVTKGYKPVHWCCDCGSSLAEAEVDYKNRISPAIDIKFKFVDSSFFDVQKDISLIIWTTTPWTIPANEAVAVHPDFEYSLIDIGSEYLLLATELLEDSLVRYGYKNYKIVDKKYQGYELENLELQHPFYDKKVPIILGEHVTVEAGTGAVHTAPAHGAEDYVVGLKYNLPVDCPINDKGVFYDDVELFAGQFVFKANQNILEVLRQKGKLLCHQDIKHSYPHCWRHKSPIIFRATPQWFISMEKQGLRQTVKEQIKNVKWFPDWGQKRIELMIGSRPDWCVSRQRYWGSPITLFVDKKTGDLHPNTQELIEKIALNIEKEGIEYWFNCKAEDLDIDSNVYEKTTDTLDVWFDSGVSFFAVLNQRKELASLADLYLEGSDQHRGWFQSSILASCAITKKAPYKQVLTHGFIVDEKGVAFSKSLGNGIAPQQIINKLGADILRLWVASADYTNEITVSDDILKRSSDVYRRIRNTMRFMLANMQGFDANKHLVKTADLLALDRWIINKTAKLQEKIIVECDVYNFHSVVKLISNFCSNDLGGFYLDIIKDRQYTTQTNSLARRSAQTTLFHISHAMVRWLSPILSFTAEEIYQYIPKYDNSDDSSVFIQNWYQDLESNYKNVAIDTAREVSSFVRQQIEKMRNEKSIGSSLEAGVDLYCSDTIYQNLSQLEDELRFIFITSYARIYSLAEKPKGAATVSDDIAIKVTKSSHQKCVRCWHRREDVGQNKEHPELCLRCVDNVVANGEKRVFA